MKIKKILQKIDNLLAWKGNDLRCIKVGHVTYEYAKPKQEVSGSFLYISTTTKKWCSWDKKVWTKYGLWTLNLPGFFWLVVTLFIDCPCTIIRNVVAFLWWLSRCFLPKNWFLSDEEKQELKIQCALKHNWIDRKEYEEKKGSEYKKEKDK